MLQSNWISVKERLPKEDGKYLVSYEWPYGLDSLHQTYKGTMFEVGIAYWYSNLHTLDPEQFPEECGGFVEIDERTLSYACYSNLTAWMSMPDPYKTV